MTANPSATAPLSDLMDSFAMVAMEQFISTYAPEQLGSPEETVEWCKMMAGMSYAMAGTMMNTRLDLHSQMTKETNAA